MSNASSTRGNEMSIKILSRPNMKKYGTIWEAEVNGVLLCRKDGCPSRFGSYEAAEKAAFKASKGKRDDKAHYGNG